jgi:sigma-E factor negative regulatory protein RseB
MAVPLQRGFRAAILAAAVLAAPMGRADDAASWLNRAATAARQQNYLGTIVYQAAGRIESSRLVHLNDDGAEFEKLVNLDGPAREVIRSHAEVRCYYPDAKLVRIEPRTFRNAFPSLSQQQLRSLSDYYEFRRAEQARVAGLDTQAVVFEPKDGLRYGHKFWADAATELLLKARMLDERGEAVEQYAFIDLTVGGRIDRELVKPSWPVLPPEWVVREAVSGDMELRDTGWVVGRLPAGFTKVVEGMRSLRGKRQRVAHLVYSDGLVAVSVFIENVGSTPHPTGLTRQGGTNIFVRQFDDVLVTVLGEVPAVTVRQVAQSVARR